MLEFPNASEAAPTVRKLCPEASEAAAAAVMREVKMRLTQKATTEGR